MQELCNIAKRRGSLNRVAAAAAVLLAASRGYANILSTSATVRPNNPKWGSHLMQALNGLSQIN